MDYALGVGGRENILQKMTVGFYKQKTRIAQVAKS